MGKVFNYWELIMTLETVNLNIEDKRFLATRYKNECSTFLAICNVMYDTHARWHASPGPRSLAPCRQIRKSNNIN